MTDEANNSIEVHGGNVYKLAQKLGCKPEEILDFSVSINPLGFPEGIRAAVNRALDLSIHYPDTNCTALKEVISRTYGCPVEQTIVANGTTEIFHLMPQALNFERAVIPTPCYIDYAKSAELAGLQVDFVQLRQSDDYAVNWDELDVHLKGGELVYLARPNNPTGTTFSTAEFTRFAAKHPKTVFVVDEAYLDFAQAEFDLIKAVPENVIVTLSLTKFYGIPGLRLGFAVAPEPYISMLKERIPPWSVNNLAQAAGIEMLQDKAYAEATRTLISEQRQMMIDRLSQLDGLKIYPGIGNFLFLQITRQGYDASLLAEKLLKQKIAIRVCDNYPGLDATYFRIGIKSAEDNEVIVAAIEAVLTDKPSSRPPRTKTPAIMLQGIASNAGKSVLTAALCRILLQDGIKVAPFKAQNMSLNSFVTRAGLEMGRAQVTQAQACWLEPDVRMNPVLLKPSSDTGSQIIVNGKPVANMSVNDYIAYKETAFKAAKDSYDSLAGEFDTIILEGAGSPGEVNLKKHDIVNMRMAQYADAAVLLAGDIDRGGVFASFVGTMDVLSQWERELVKGFVINRFRGDASLLVDATDYTMNYTGKPTVGVVPFLRDLGLPEEDSVEFKSGALDGEKPACDHIEIAVIDLAHISNFTDFDALRAEDDVYVRIVRKPEQLGTPDAVILPGSKNVIKDLEILRQTGMADALLTLKKSRNIEVIGICGGFQMLGNTIADPLGIESATASTPGLGFLDVTTELAAEKTLVRTETVHSESGSPVLGYEIHHGQTEVGQGTVYLGTSDTPTGFCSEDRTVWGTYLHGVFDSDLFRRWLINSIRQRKGLVPLASGTPYDIEPALNRLADVVRESLDMDAIYKLLER